MKKKLLHNKVFSIKQWKDARSLEAIQLQVKNNASQYSNKKLTNIDDFDDDIILTGYIIR
jgi:hypothetical protein